MDFDLFDEVFDLFPDTSHSAVVFSQTRIIVISFFIARIEKPIKIR